MSAVVTVSSNQGAFGLMFLRCSSATHLAPAVPSAVLPLEKEALGTPWGELVKWISGRKMFHVQKLPSSPRELSYTRCSLRT